MKQKQITISENDILNLIANSHIARIDINDNGEKINGYARNVEAYAIGNDFIFDIKHPNGGMWSYSAELKNTAHDTRLILIYDIFVIRTIKNALANRLAAQYVMDLDTALFQKNNALWSKLARIKQ